ERVVAGTRGTAAALAPVAPSAPVTGLAHALARGERVVARAGARLGAGTRGARTGGGVGRGATLGRRPLAARVGGRGRRGAGTGCRTRRGLLVRGRALLGSRLCLLGSC